MLNECMSIFENYAGGNVDKLILDNYIPANGFYLILEETETGFQKKEQHEIILDKKTRELNITFAERVYISRLDYHSSLVDMNKPVDSKKIIQSNNYLSFWIKQESLSNGKLNHEIIDGYYEILADPYMKYSKGRNKELYQMVEDEIGPVNQQKLMKVKQWVKENIFQLNELSGKDYLKIFFLCDGVSIEQEGKRYLVPNLFNKNDYNIRVDGDIYGLPNENMGLNSKKPYLENKNRKYTVPMLLRTSDSMKRKKFFDYLWGLACKGYYNVYFDSRGKVVPLEPKAAPREDLTGYFLRIRKDKNEAAILDMDTVNFYQPKLKTPFLFDNILNLDTKKLEGHRYGNNSYLYDICDIVNTEIFSNFLLGNFYNEPSDISCNNDGVIKENILLARNRLFNWFFKGCTNDLAELMEKVSVNLIQNTISNGYMEKVQHQFNAYISVLEYLKGGKVKMAYIMEEVRGSIRDKINQRSHVQAESDEEYYYAAGQLIRYFISLNKSKNKIHSLFNPFLTIKKDELLKLRLEDLFKKYNYGIDVTSPRFNNIYTMITHYVPKGSINHTFLIAGYISNNLIYEKKEENDNE
ncbi:CRISPR-associated protein [Anaerocolumna jejuensis]|uniref:CRISPR-associated protein n=1 Tax=Anaerocolumna jejuensis TaxID=259063 RepID=UPI003F7B9A41